MLYLGKLQRGGNGLGSSEVQTDSNGNEISKEYKYEILEGYEPKNQCYELIKAGDVDVPKEDSKLDEDNDRKEIRDSLGEQTVVIRTNVNDILHHGSVTSQEAEAVGLIDGRASYSNMYKKIIPELLGLDEKSIIFIFTSILSPSS